MTQLPPLEVASQILSARFAQFIDYPRILRRQPIL
jgi:hypothetical protein